MFKFLSKGLFKAVTESESETTDTEGQLKRRSLWGNGNKYYYSVRVVLLVSLILMALLSLSIFTKNARMKGGRTEALLVVMASYLIAGLGFYAVFKVKPKWIAIFAALQLILMIYKFTSKAFSNELLASMFLHIPHFFVLFCSWSFLILALCCYS